MSKRLASTVCWALLFAVATLLLPNGKAHAYLDPASGSFILQVIVASLLGGLLSLKLFWKQIAGVFRKSESPGEPESPEVHSSDIDEKS
jgi:hypothetical protein